MRLHHYESRATEVDTPGPKLIHVYNETVHSEDLTNVLVELVDTGVGFLGVYPVTGAFLHVVISSPTEMEFRTVGTVGNAPLFPEEEPEPDKTFYSRRVVGEHLHAALAATMRYEGAGAMKFQGPIVRVTSNQSTVTYETGIEKGPGLANERVERWMFIEFPEGAVIELESIAPLEVATSLVILRGDAPAPAEITSVAWAWPLLAVTLGGAALASGVLAARRRTPTPIAPLPAAAPVGDAPPPTPPYTAEDCLAFADAEIGEERWGPALEWVQRARRLALASRRVWQAEAYVLSELGLHAEALAAYEEASRRSPDDGHPDLMAAHLAADAGELPSVVEAWLSRALRKSPNLAGEIATSDTFAPLRDRPGLRRLLDEARVRLDAGPPDEDEDDGPTDLKR